MSKFKPNQKVVCIDDSPAILNRQRYFVKGNTYIIKEVDEDGDVRLVGVPHINTSWFLGSRFRPQVPRSEAMTELMESQKFNESKEERIDTPVKIEQR